MAPYQTVLLLSLSLFSVSQASPVNKNDKTTNSQACNLLPIMKPVLGGAAGESAFCSSYLGISASTIVSTTTRKTVVPVATYLTTGTVTVPGPLRTTTTSQTQTNTVTKKGSTRTTTTTTRTIAAGQTLTSTALITATETITATVYDDGTFSYKRRAVPHGPAQVDPLPEIASLEKRAIQVPQVLRAYAASSLSAACSCMTLPSKTITSVITQWIPQTSIITIPVRATVTGAPRVVSVTVKRTQTKTISQFSTSTITSTATTTTTPVITQTSTLNETTTSTQTIPASEGLSSVTSIILAETLQPFCYEILGYSTPTATVTASASANKRVKRRSACRARSAAATSSTAAATSATTTSNATSVATPSDLTVFPSALVTSGCAAVVPATVYVTASAS